MPINWITAFKLIPWSDVVQATPTVVRGAKDLWSRTRKAASKSAVLDESGQTEAGGVEQLSLHAIRHALQQLESEQLEASALISTLAEQNAQLVAALDNVRSRVRLLTAACVLLALGVAGVWLR